MNITTIINPYTNQINTINNHSTTKKIPFKVLLAHVQNFHDPKNLEIYQKSSSWYLLEKILKELSITTHTMAGLSFDNHQRNQFLSAKGYGAPTATSTGTTIVGVKFDGGVVVSITILKKCENKDDTNNYIDCCRYKSYSRSNCC